MTDKDVIVQKIEKRTGNSNNTWYLLETNEGPMSVWNEEIWDELLKVTLPATFNLNVVQKGKYTNVQAIVMNENGQSPKSTPAPEQTVKKDRVLFWEKKPLSEIVNELNKLDTIATQFYQKGDNYDCVAWLR